MASRLVLEPELTPSAVASAAGVDLAVMDRGQRRGAEASGSDEFERWAIALRHGFAVGAHNAALVSVGSLLVEARRQPVWGGGSKRRTVNSERHRCSCEEHERIVPLSVSATRGQPTRSYGSACSVCGARCSAIPTDRSVSHGRRGAELGDSTLTRRCGRGRRAGVRSR